MDVFDYTVVFFFFFWVWPYIEVSLSMYTYHVRQTFFKITKQVYTIIIEKTNKIDSLKYSRCAFMSCCLYITIKSIERGFRLGVSRGRIVTWLLIFQDTYIPIHKLPGHETMNFNSFQLNFPFAYCNFYFFFFLYR